MDEKNNEKDFQSFLSKVDEIESIVKGLTSCDDKVCKTSIQKADEFMNRINEDTGKLVSRNPEVEEPDLKTVVDRTVINKDACKNERGHPDAQLRSCTDQADFMASLEKDCQERAERKRRMKKEAEKLKDEGNVEFAKGNYENAVTLYKQATEKIKDWDILHTNLAQAHIRLRQFDAALEACTWAFRVNENCLKAFILQGKAYVGLKQYEKAMDSYTNAIRAAPEKETMIFNSYILQVKTAIESDTEEASATKLFDEGDSAMKGLVEILKKLNRPEQPLLFYSGGLRVVQSLITDGNSKTLLRINESLNLTQTHPAIAKCFSKMADELSEQEADVCTEYLNVLQLACDDNDANKMEILQVTDLHIWLMKLVESNSHNKVHIQPIVNAAVQLLFRISETEVGRQGILAKYEVARLVSSLSSILTSTQSIQCIGVLNNLTLEKKFRVEMCSCAEDALIPSLENLMENAESFTVVTTAVYILTNLAIETFLRRKLASRTQTWKACLKILMKCSDLPLDQQNQETVFSVLGLLANLGLEKTSDDFRETGLQLCVQCSKMIGRLRLQGIKEADHGLLQRLCLLLSRLLVATGETVVLQCQDLIIPEILEILKSDAAAATKSGVACLAACTKTSAEARKQIVEYPKGLKTLLDLLKSPDEAVVGNAALCLSHCAELPKVCKALAKTNVMMELLVLARDTTKPTVQHNCAILVAKLSQGDHRHLERLRELHGHEILNTVLHHVKE